MSQIGGKLFLCYSIKLSLVFFYVAIIFYHKMALCYKFRNYRYFLIAYQKYLAFILQAVILIITVLLHINFHKAKYSIIFCFGNMQFW